MRVYKIAINDKGEEPILMAEPEMNQGIMESICEALRTAKIGGIMRIEIVEMTWEEYRVKVLEL